MRSASLLATAYYNLLPYHGRVHASEKCSASANSNQAELEPGSCNSYTLVSLACSWRTPQGHSPGCLATLLLAIVRQSYGNRGDDDGAPPLLRWLAVHTGREARLPLLLLLLLL